MSWDIKVKLVPVYDMEYLKLTVVFAYVIITKRCNQY